VVPLPKCLLFYLGGFHYSLKRHTNYCTGILKHTVKRKVLRNFAHRITKILITCPLLADGIDKNGKNWVGMGIALS